MLVECFLQMLSSKGRSMLFSISWELLSWRGAGFRQMPFLLLIWHYWFFFSLTCWCNGLHCDFLMLQQPCIDTTWWGCIMSFIHYLIQFPNILTFASKFDRFVYNFLVVRSLGSSDLREWGKFPPTYPLEDCRELTASIMFDTIHQLTAMYSIYLI